MPISLTPALEQEYQELYDSIEIPESRRAAVNALAASLVANRAEYEKVATRTGVPWQIVAVIHNMEATQDFKCHLHNGDKLTARTTRIPKGRPAKGNPPFTWEDSAVDALEYDGFTGWTDWSLPGTLYKLERYNGMGYRMNHPKVKTPYLWSFCQHYTRGKYGSDKKFDPDLVSRQCGAAVLLHRLGELGHPLPVTEKRPLPDEFRDVRYAPKTYNPAAEALQAWLNQQPGIAVEVDGKAGRRTSDAIRRVTGSYLPGDPRA